MARNFTSYFETPDPVDVGSGAIVTTSPEGALQRNVNWLQANMIRPLVWDVFGRAAVSSTASNPWLDVSTGNDSAATVVGSYMTRVPRDFATYRVKARVKNAHASSAGVFVIRVKSSGTTATVAIPANAENTVSLDIAVNTSRTFDILNIGIQNGSSDSDGVCSIQSVLIYPVPLSSPLAAGVSTQGFVPLDGVEIAGNAPMSTHLRNTQYANLTSLTKKRRAPQLLSWSENIDLRSAGHSMLTDSDTGYTLVANIPIYIPEGFTKIQWGALGYTASGTGGKVKITTLDDTSGEESDAFGTTWAAGGFNDAVWQWPSACTAENPKNVLGELDVLPDTWETLSVYLKSGSTAVTYLKALSVWAKEG